MEELKKDLESVVNSLRDSSVLCANLYSNLINKTKPGEPDFSKRLEILSRLNQVVTFFMFLENDFKEKTPEISS